MQESVTENYETVNHKKTNKIVIYFLLLIFVCFIVLLIFLSIKPKSGEFFNGKVFYCYYTSCNNNFLKADDIADDQRSYGGAGYVLKKEKYYICAFLYEDENKAKAVMLSNKNIFKDGGVVKINTQKLSKKAKKTIKNSEIIKEFANLYEENFNKIYNLAINTEKQKLKESEVFNVIYKILNNYLYIKNNLKDEDFSIVVFLDRIIEKLNKYLENATSLVDRNCFLKYLCFEILKEYNLFADFFNDNN